jgi:hypothetical protein
MDNSSWLKRLIDFTEKRHLKKHSVLSHVYKNSLIQNLLFMIWAFFIGFTLLEIMVLFGFLPHNLRPTFILRDFIN